jgi:hypothetical protein
MDALRFSLRAGNLHALARVRDKRNGNQMAVAAAARALEQLGNEAEQRPAGIGAARTPGLVIVITDGRSNAPGRFIDGGQVRELPSASA